MKSSVMTAAVGGVLLATAMTTPVLAATHKPAKMTCEEFVALDEVSRPKVVYWAEGYSRKGKPTDTVVDIERTDRMIPMLVTDCEKTPKATLWQKFKKHF